MISLVPADRRHRRTVPDCVTHEEIEKAIGRVAKSYRMAMSDRSRYRIRPYLQEVYRLYRRWDDQGDLQRLVRDAAFLANVRVRKGAHPLKILVDLTCTEQDPKERSRWAAALRYADSQSVCPDRLGSFIERHGGVATLAHRAANARKWR